jgi:hypothetical protein
MKNKMFALVVLLHTFVFKSFASPTEHQEVFIGMGKTSEEARVNAYQSIYSQGKPINSCVSIETRKNGNDNYITVFKIKTQ